MMLLAPFFIPKVAFTPVLGVLMIAFFVCVIIFFFPSWYIRDRHPKLYIVFMVCCLWSARHCFESLKVSA